ncbi:MAG: aminoglycoside phosphotransferase family protein [Rhodospirillaceae bacterium]
MTEVSVIAVLRRLAVIGDAETPSMTPLAGGVSSDIWRVDAASGPLCVKRALAKLRTEKDWFAPVERNASEAEWIRTAGEILPSAVPRLIAEDREAGLFAMEYLEPGRFPVWKTLLREGTVDDRTAQAVGDTLGRIHAGTARDDAVAARFRTDHIFHPIRIVPYLLATADAHPDMSDRLHRLASVTASTRHALVHGDVSPKNILIGPEGPVFLDAECAWYGDPAFDLAFCLNHLLLKSIWRPQWRDGYFHAFAALSAGYFRHVGWESPTELESRTAALLPGLLLARIDGTSPVEYITGDGEKDRVRKAARAALSRMPTTLAGVCRMFMEEAFE